MTTWLVSALGLFLAGLVHGVTGFGFGMVAMGVLVLAMPVRDAVPVVAVFLLLSNLALGWRLRGHIRRQRVLPLVAGGLLGLPLGVLFLQRVEPAYVKGAMGGILLVLVTARLRQPAGAAAPAGAWGPVAGFFGGVLGGAFNTPLPPVTMYAALQRWEPDVVRATLQAFAVVTTTVALVLYTAAGLVTEASLTKNAVLVLAPLAGLALGAKVSTRIGSAAFDRLLLVALAGLGVLYLGELRVLWPS